MADAVSAASEEEPDLIIDIATLTGAARVALGTDLPAIFCNDDAVAEKLADAGVRTHDMVRCVCSRMLAYADVCWQRRCLMVVSARMTVRRLKGYVKALFLRLSRLY